MPAPKKICIKDLYTGKTRVFKSQTEADDFYGKKRGYFKDVKTKLGGKNKKYEILNLGE